jgi:DNA polymerase epsilon subunit 2
MEHLAKVFQGFENVLLNTNILFILMGTFITKPINALGGRILTSTSFSNLADLILEYPTISAHSKFVFVPGPNDAGVCNNILPRKGIPDYFTSEVKKKLPNAHFASNPCRVQFYSQEIVLFREDLLNKLQRNSLFKISSNFDPSEIQTSPSQVS